MKLSLVSLYLLCKVWRWLRPTKRGMIHDVIECTVHMKLNPLCESHAFSSVVIPLKSPLLDDHDGLYVQFLRAVTPAV